jgi:hypothetical protein
MKFSAVIQLFVIDVKVDSSVGNVNLDDVAVSHEADCASGVVPAASKSS